MIREKISAAGYDDWYVLQVGTNKEYYIKEIADRLLVPRVRLIVFSREIVHKKNGKSLALTGPLFPGYIFVHREIGRVAAILKRRLYNEFIRPVSFNGRPAGVYAAEMERLLSNSDDTGKFTLSYAYVEGESITISGGPLKNLTGKIIFINRKKRKARVRFNLFNQDMEVSLGLNFIDRADNPFGLSSSFNGSKQA